MKKSMCLLCVLSLLLAGCCPEPPEPPTLTTIDVSDITRTTALSGGKITDDGGAAVTERGVCWNTSAIPTISDNTKTSGTGMGSFTCLITDLSPQETYYVRAYAINSEGIGYGEEKSFVTEDPGIPTITTNIVSNITTTTASCGGNITDDGGSAVTSRGVCWNTSANPTITNNKTTDGTGTGPFTSSLTGLSPGVTYYVRAYATNSVGTGYGDEKSFRAMEFTKYSGNPVLLPGSSASWDKEFVGAGSVVYYNSKYHMWYTGGRFSNSSNPPKIGYATSDDGITWIKYANNPVLDKGTAGGWEDSFLHLPVVMVISNTFHMWYTGHRGTNGGYDFQIGHATSTDGATWTKDPNNPVLPMGSAGSWDCNWVSIGSVLYDGVKYHMWYFGCYNTVKIGHATSSDGLAWTKDPANPVLAAGSAGSWDNPRIDFPVVIYDGGSFHMWYSGGNYFNWKIGYATSPDGSVWTKKTYMVLSVGPSGSWDSRSVAAMSVIVNSGKYKMWYSGSQAEELGSIGYAEKTAK